MSVPLITCLKSRLCSPSAFVSAHLSQCLSTQISAVKQTNMEQSTSSIKTLKRDEKVSVQQHQNQIIWLWYLTSFFIGEIDAATGLTSWWSDLLCFVDPDSDMVKKFLLSNNMFYFWFTYFFKKSRVWWFSTPEFWIFLRHQLHDFVPRKIEKNH